MPATVAKQLLYTTSLGYEASRLRIAPRNNQTVSGHKQRSEAELRMTAAVAKQLLYTTSLGCEASRLRIAPRSIQTVRVAFISLMR